ncbi:hypothetical protein ABPG72_014156 [Tetrahymena utriculariae]
MQICCLQSIFIQFNLSKLSGRYFLPISFRNQYISPNYLLFQVIDFKQFNSEQFTLFFSSILISQLINLLFPQNIYYLNSGSDLISICLVRKQTKSNQDLDFSYFEKIYSQFNRFSKVLFKNHRFIRCQLISNQKSICNLNFKFKALIQTTSMRQIVRCNKTILSVIKAFQIFFIGMCLNIKPILQHQLLIVWNKYSLRLIQQLELNKISVQEQKIDCNFCFITSLQYIIQIRSYYILYHFQNLKNNIFTLDREI